MRVIGIDPGYDRLGIAIIEKIESQKERLIYSECFITDKKETVQKRLLDVGMRVREIIKKYNPDVLAIENLFITKNQKTATRVSEARGVIAYESMLSGLDVFEYTPLQVKMAITGHGKSDKDQIIKMIPMLIKIDKTGKNKKIIDDEYDAIGVALTHIAYSKSFPQN